MACSSGPPASECLACGAAGSGECWQAWHCKRATGHNGCQAVEPLVQAPSTCYDVMPSAKLLAASPSWSRLLSCACQPHAQLAMRAPLLSMAQQACIAAHRAGGCQAPCARNPCMC